MGRSTRAAEHIHDHEVDGALQTRGQLLEYFAGVAVPHTDGGARRPRQFLTHELDEVGLELDDLLP